MTILRITLILSYFIIAMQIRPSNAQDLVSIDSLHKELKRTSSDSSKAYFHSEICYNWCGINFDSAWYHASYAHTYGLNSGLDNMIRLGLTAKGWAHDWNYQFDSAIFYYNASYDLSKKNDDRKGMAISLFNIGVTFFYQGKLDSSLYYYSASEPIFEILDDKPNLSRLYNNLGRIYEKTKRYDMALVVSRRSIRIKKELKNNKGLLNTYTNMSSIFQRIEKYDSSLYYSQKCMDLAKKIGDELAYRGELINLGISYKNLGQADKSFAAYQEAESLIEDKDDPYIRLQIYLNLGEYYLEKKQLKKVNENLLKMKNHLLEEDYLESTIHYYSLEYAFHKASGNYQLGLESLEKYLNLNNRYLDQKTIEKTAELEQLYEKANREKEIANLNLENENQRNQIILRNNQRNVLVLLSIIALIIIIFVYIRYRSKAKISRLLEEKNKQVNVALVEREDLLKEIHHRVKNNLQVISSLLNLQSESLENDSAKEAVLEGKNRVKSMALIHQNLYLTNDIRGVNFQQYAGNLISQLVAIYDMQDSLEYKINCEEFIMDIDTVIPLGLVLNELVTNSLKYAFDGQSNGDLNLSLKEIDNELIMILKDNGKGLNEDEIESSNSFGWKIVRSLSRKLKAKISIISEGGTTIKLVMSRYKLVE
ncbi:MAG: tetratricopeptide repeat protein [Reichenbachiella sp.]